MDFSDFQSERDVANAPAPQQEEALWKAYAPSKVEERHGDIIVTIPYQKQKRQEDMEPDTTAPQQSFDLIIRAYEPNIVRILFSEIPGAVIQIRDIDFDYVDAELLLQDVAFFPLGHPNLKSGAVRVRSAEKTGIQTILESLMQNAEGED